MAELNFTGIGAVPTTSGATTERREVEFGAPAQPESVAPAVQPSRELSFPEPAFLENSTKASRTTPEATAFDRKLADVLGLPPDAVSDGQRKSLTEQATQRRMDLDTQDAPVTRNLFEFDPELNALASDDTDNLRRSERVARQLTLTGSFSNGFDLLHGLGWRFVEASAEAIGAEGLEDAATARARENFEDITRRGQKTNFTDIDWTSDDAGSQFFRFLVTNGGEQIPLMVAPVVGGAVGGVIGGVLGSGAGPVGTAAGATAGAVWGSRFVSMVLGVGEVQQGIKDRNADVEAPGTAFAAGAVVGLIDSIIPGRIGSRFVKAWGLEKGERALRLVAARVAVEAAKQAPMEVITEVVQETIAEFASANATDQEVDIQELGKQLIDVSAVAFFMGTGTGLVSGTSTEVIRAREVKNTMEALDELSGKSKLKGRAADKHAEVLAAQMEAGGVDSVYVPVTALLQFAGKQEGGVAQALQDLGVSETLADIIGTAPDAKVQISAENFSSAVLGTEGFKILSRHLTVSPEAKSFQEAADSIISDDETEAQLLEELDQYEAAEDLKARVKETIGKLKGGAAEAVEKAPTDVNAVLMDVINRVSARQGSVADQIRAGRVDFLDEQIAGIDREIAVLEKQLELANKANTATVRIQNAIDKLGASRDAADTEQANLTFEARKAGLLDEFSEDIVQQDDFTEGDQLNARLEDLQDQKAEKDAELKRAVLGDNKTLAGRIRKQRTQLNKDIKEVEDRLGVIDPVQDDTATPKKSTKTKADQALGKTIIQVKGKVLQALNVKITRESVRAAREGFKAALAVGKSLTARKRSISKQIEKNKWLTEGQKLTLTNRLNRANTDEQLTKTATAVQARAAVLVEQVRKRQIKSALIKELGKVQSKKQGGKDIGRMDADTQAFVDEVSDIIDDDTQAFLDEVSGIMDLSVAHAEERLEAVNSGVEERGGKKSVLPPEDALFSTLLAIAANFDELNVTDAENALLDIVKVIELGKAEGLKRVLQKRARKNAAVEGIREAVTQGQPVGELSTTGFFNRLKRNQKNLSTWLGAMHNGWDEILDIVINTKGADVSGLIESLRMTKYVQAHKARSRKWQAEMQQIGIDIYQLSGEQQLHEKHVEDSDVQDFGLFENLNGKKVRLQYSKAQIRKLWMEMQDPSIAEVLHAENGMAWTLDMRFVLFDELNDADKAYARAQLDFYKKMYPQVNAVYRKMYGVNLPFNEFYSPIQRDKGDVEDGMNAEFGSDIVLVDEIKFRKSLPGQIKNRTGSIAPLKIHSDVGVMQRYMHDMAWFIESTEQVMHLKSVFKNEQLKKEIAHHHGDQMNRFIDSFLQDFGTGYAARGMVAEAGFNTINRLYSGSVLALKGTIATKQLVSWFAMADNIPAASFMAAHADFAKNPKKIIKFLYENSPALQARGSSLDFELAKIGAGNQPLFQWKKGNQWENLKFALIKFGDRVPIYAGGWAVYQHNLKVTGSHDKAIAAFEDAMSTTQQSTDIDKLSEMQRMGAIGRTLTMFMTARMALLRGEIRAMRQLRRGKITFREFGKRFAIYHFIMPMAIQYIASGFEWDEDRQLVAAALGQLNSLVIFGDMMMLAVEQMMAVDGFQPSDEMPITGMLKDLWDGVEDAFTASSPEDVLLAIAEIAGAIGHVSGQPVDQVVNMVKGAAKIGDGDVEEGAKLLFGFSETVARESSNSR